MTLAITLESTQMDQPGRLHSFDNLRAVMMWLGIILHVAINHTTGASSPLPWRDSQTSPIADLIVVFIHAFRMPVFFILAGYFVALLIAQHGHTGMLRHRLRRLALPFAIFWPVLIVCTTLLMLVYLHMMAYDTPGIELGLLPRAGTSSPFNTMHMWFIYYLIWFSALTALLAPAVARLPAGLRENVDGIFRTLASNWWGPFILAIPLAVIGSFYRAGMMNSSGSFIPNPNELLHNGLFFVFGLLMFRHQDSLFALYTKRSWKYTIAGLVVFVLALGALRSYTIGSHGVPNIEFLIAFLYNLTSWLLSLGLIGLFLRYLPTQNRVLRYVSESSYWVFLVHMLGTIGFGAMVYGLPAGPLTKMALNIIATTAACLLTYQVLVRHTLIGVLLNGRRRGKAAPVPAPAVAEPS